MTLSRYLATRFLSAFLGISGALAVIYNLIELMEKLTRTSHGLSTILPFLALNFIPTWLDMLPISSWLAMLVVIYRLQLQEEWFTCRLLGLKDRQLLLPVMVTLLGTVLGVVAVRQLGGEALRTKVQQYHARVFKRRQTHAVTNQWYTLPSLDLVHIQQFDHATQRGSGLTWYQCHEGVVRTHEYVPTFALHAATLQAPRSERYHYDSQQLVTHHTMQRTVPALAYALQQQVQSPSFFGLLTAWWQAPAGDAHAQTLGLQLAAEALPLVEIIIFALLTLLLFLVLPLRAPYPLMVAASGYPACLLIKNMLSTQWPDSFFALIIGYFALLAVAKVSGSRILKIAITRF